MIERARMPVVAAHVIVASTVLDDGAKRVVEKVAALCSHKGTAFISGPTLAFQLGWSVSTLRRVTGNLQRLGLLASSAENGQRAGWYITLPSDCIPTKDRRDDREIESLVERLDDYLAPRLKVLADEEKERKGRERDAALVAEAEMGTDAILGDTALSTNSAPGSSAR